MATSLLLNLIAVIAFTLLPSSTITSAAIPPPQIFFNACHSGDIATITDLLSEHPTLVHSTSRDGDHCIHIVTIDGRVDIIRVLLENGANPNIQSLPVNRMRMHPLGWAAIFGRYEAMELLINYGAHVNTDFDIEMGNGQMKELTALDVVEMMLDTNQDADSSIKMREIVMNRIGKESEGKERFAKTMEVLMKHGAKRVSELNDGSNDEL